jgi:hypothetical protein
MSRYLSRGIGAIIMKIYAEQIASYRSALRIDIGSAPRKI